MEKKDQKKEPKREWRRGLAVLVAIFLAFFVRTFVWTAYRVPTSSMSPTLLRGDFIFVYKWPYGIHFPWIRSKLAMLPLKRGDVVVFTFSEHPQVNYVKRVIGVSGDQIEISNGELSVNGKKFQYELVREPPGESVLKGEEDLTLNFSLYKERTLEEDRLVLRKKVGNKSFGPLVVPPGEIFLLGDNRDASDDLRYWGTVPVERVEGQVRFIWLSLDWSKRWGKHRLPEIRRERFLTRIR